jgi:hypothetical protein
MRAGYTRQKAADSGGSRQASSTPCLATAEAGGARAAVSCGYNRCSSRGSGGLGRACEEETSEGGDDACRRKGIKAAGVAGRLMKCSGGFSSWGQFTGPGGGRGLITEQELRYPISTRCQLSVQRLPLNRLRMWQAPGEGGVVDAVLAVPVGRYEAAVDA